MTVERGQGSPRRNDAVFVGIQKHWSSFIGILLHTPVKCHNILCCTVLHDMYYNSS